MTASNTAIVSPASVGNITFPFLRVDTTLTTEPSINVAGVTTITLPLVPTTNQTVFIHNVGINNVTVIGPDTPFTLPSSQEATFIWGGYSWGICAPLSGTSIGPTTYNFPTTVFAGPSETPYTVPETTVEYVTIANTNCGLYRKVITKTYASRSEANQRKVVVNYAANITAIGEFVTPIYGASGTYLGATRIACLNLWQTAVIPFLQVSVDSGWGQYFDNPHASASTPSQIEYDKYTSPGGALIAANQPIYAANENAEIALTLYYLDVTETWSYEIV